MKEYFKKVVGGLFNLVPRGIALVDKLLGYHGLGFLVASYAMIKGIMPAWLWAIVFGAGLTYRFINKGLYIYKGIKEAGKGG